MDVRAGYETSYMSPSLAGSAISGGHWTFGLGQRPPFEEAVMVSEQAAAHPPTTTSFVADGVRVGETSIPPEKTDNEPGFYSGHVVFRWRACGAWMYLTVHDHRNEPLGRALVSATISSLRC